MKTIIRRLQILAAALLLSSSAHALTWLGYQEGNDDEALVESFLSTYYGAATDVTLLGKSDDGTNPAGFTPNLNTLQGSSSGGPISYTGLENISFLTFKVGNVGGGQTPPDTGFHVYAWSGGGSFNLLTDPNPDFPSQGNTISHISVWTTPGGDIPGVPDSGSVLGLLGIAFVSVAGIRRFFTKA